MSRLANKISSQETYTAISSALPNDHSRRVSAQSFIEQVLTSQVPGAKVLDLGCGEGASLDLFRRMVPDVRWQGVDIEDSPEVRRRRRDSDLFATFDGVNLPYPDAGFDLLYCHQVLEHVRHPDALIAEAWRVTRPGGWFIGSVSYLEPYHSYSVFNFTPYGVVRVFSDAGFEVRELRPGADAAVMINRQLLNRSNALRFIWRWNVLHGLVGMIGAVSRLEQRQRNFLKVQFSGHLVFIAQRPPA